MMPNETPLPTEGGSYIRNPDGSLTRQPEGAPVSPAPPVASPAADSTRKPAKTET